MPFGRLHEEAAGESKLLALSDAAWRMWAMGLIYCQKNLTDGFIAENAIATFGVRGVAVDAIVAIFEERRFAARVLEAVKAVLGGLRLSPRDLATELCTPQVPGRAALWERIAGGYQVHDYLQWNDSKVEILKKRAEGKDRVTRWRERHAADLRNNIPNTEQHSEQNASRDALQAGEQSGDDVTRSETRSHVVRGSSSESKRSANPTNAELRGMTRLIEGPHPHHALCGRPCMHNRQYREFISKLGGDEQAAAGRIDAFYEKVQAKYAGKPIPTADDFKFWNAEYDLEFGQPIAGQATRASAVPSADETRDRQRRLREDAR